MVSLGLRLLSCEFKPDLFEGTGYLSRKVQNLLLLLCMIPKLDLMQDVRSIVFLQNFLLRIISDSLVCPHVSFDNPQASKEAPPRESIETRSLVITKE